MLTLEENPLINGCMDAADDTTSLTAAGKIMTSYEVLDLGTSGAATISQQSITTAPWNSTDKLPRGISKFLRWAQTTGGTATSPTLLTKIPRVATFADKIVTFQGFYRSNVAVNVLLRQKFGSGGSPTANVDTAAKTLPATTDSSGTVVWSPFSVSFKLAPVDGLTLGTTGNTAYLGVVLQGPQSVTFQYDLTDLRLVRGGQRDPAPQRDVEWEKIQTRRFYSSSVVYAPVSTQSAAWIPFPAQMVAAPTITSTGATSANITVNGCSLISAGAAGVITLVADSRIAG